MAMDRCSLLDCTLRDGGYITDWKFGAVVIRSIIHDLIEAGVDYIECGYLNSKPYEEGSAVFNNIEQIAEFIPKERRDSCIFVMADVAQFTPDDLTPYTGNSVDGVRVVFYKRQVEEALQLCAAVSQKGYKLIVQPMVTIDYSVNEYAQLVRRIAKLTPYAVSIVDSFGYMDKEDVRKYFRILDNLLPFDAIIGYHSHNNMQLAFSTAQDLLTYDTQRRIMIDASLYGMGRGAGNLHTEVIADFYNRIFGVKYNLSLLLKMLGEFILPIRKDRSWGYSPYLFITGRYHCHPNFACYLLENHEISVGDFERFVQTIPKDMKTKCRRPYVEELYQAFIKGAYSHDCKGL